MDTLRVSLAETCPKPHQPENWRVRRPWYSPWHNPCCRVTRPASEGMEARLAAYLSDGPLLLGCRSDRVSYTHLAQAPAAQSLALIQPEDVRWQIKTSRTGKRQTRAVFRWHGTAYNLSVTDPAWEHTVRELPPGCHPSQGGGTLYFTISLSEPFEGRCYKLVAAVIVP